MCRRYLAALAVGYMLAGALPASAQEPSGLKLGPGWRLYPALEMRGTYDTNFYYTPEDERSIYGALVRPSLGLVREGNRSRSEVGVRGEIGEYFDLDEDDYQDADLFGSFRYVASSRHRFEGRAQRSLGHDPFGLQRTEAAGTEDFANRELDEFTQDEFGGRYRFGATDARINLGYEAIFIDKTYDTNRDLGTRFLDFDRTDHAFTLTYNHSPKTDLLLQAKRIEYDYINEVPSSVPRDFVQNEILVGGSWMATGKTTGRVLLGRIEHDPEDSRRNHFAEFDWDVQLDWNPTGKTTFTLNSGRRTDDSFVLDAGFIDTQFYILAWNQRWAPRVSSQLTFAHYDQEFEDLPRDDQFRRVDLEGSLVITRRLALVGGLAYLDRDSDVSRIEFTKEVVTLGFRYRP